MDKAEVAASLCQMPDYLHDHPDMSLAARLQQILASRTDPITEADLVSALHARPELIETWAAYVEDQRTSDGWYVTPSNTPTGGSEWILSRPGRKQPIVFDSPSAAYAALILRIVAQGLIGSSASHR